jgi:hypothetical protein
MSSAAAKRVDELLLYSTAEPVGAVETRSDLQAPRSVRRQQVVPKLVQQGEVVPPVVGGTKPDARRFLLVGRVDGARARCDGEVLDELDVSDSLDCGSASVHATSHATRARNDL